MPNTHSTLTGLFTDIANAIRSKAGTSSPIVADAFPAAIEAIPSGGDTSAEDGIITKEISGSYTNARVSKISESAFYSCTSLTTASFPACATIGKGAFDDCTSLTTVSFPVCTTIGSSAFRGCSSLTTASFPLCTTISNYAFEECSSLTAAFFPACTTVDNGVFYKCSSLTAISFPKCTEIPQNMFYYCRSLATASFPECNSIGTSAFYGCFSLTDVSFPMCSEIWAAAFSSCRSLTTASFPACTSINSYAFCNCNSLTTVSFPVCTTIGSSAFRGCRSLTTISFPKCTRISSASFLECVNLLSLYLSGSSVCYLGYSNAFSSTPIAGYTASTGGVYGSIYVPMLLVDAYKSATNWVHFADRIVGYEEPAKYYIYIEDENGVKTLINFPDYIEEDINADGAISIDLAFNYATDSAVIWDVDQDDNGNIRIWISEYYAYIFNVRPETTIEFGSTYTVTKQYVPQD